ncbi:Protein aveugle [Eumeta japonica]|uniref:Protein aveugle n=1 Tax=Eumeta variegata TaxID=151549 RepID=A0A4C1UMU8_EUMVA|nr:Protein aveugle [Eumeta japonica]
MVEDISSNKTKTEATRPKPVSKWTEADVQKWLRRHCSDYYQLYWERFHEHAITGRALVRLNDNTLIRMGVTNREHREAIWREILKLRLKTDILEIIDLGRPHDCHPICDIKTPGNVAISH